MDRGPRSGSKHLGEEFLDVGGDLALDSAGDFWLPLSTDWFLSAVEMHDTNSGSKNSVWCPGYRTSHVGAAAVGHSLKGAAILLPSCTTNVARPSGASFWYILVGQHTCSRCIGDLDNMVSSDKLFSVVLLEIAVVTSGLSVVIVGCPAWPKHHKSPLGRLAVCLCFRPCVSTPGLAFQPSPPPVTPVGIPARADENTFVQLLLLRLL